METKYGVNFMSKKKNNNNTTIVMILLIGFVVFIFGISVGYWITWSKVNDMVSSQIGCGKHDFSDCNCQQLQEWKDSTFMDSPIGAINQFVQWTIIRGCILK
jgi:hypothetical protein